MINIFIRHFRISNSACTTWRGPLWFLKLPIHLFEALTAPFLAHFRHLVVTTGQRILGTHTKSGFNWFTASIVFLENVIRLYNTIITILFDKLLFIYLTRSILVRICSLFLWIRLWEILYLRFVNVNIWLQTPNLII